MVTKERPERWISDIVGALTDPIIVMPGGWGDDLPEWLKTRVTMERLIENVQAMHENRGLTATDAEAACYLFTASLTAPIGSDWTHVYLYVAGGEMKDTMPEDIKVESINRNQQDDLDRLKRWIYDTRVTARKEKERGERRERRKEEATKIKTEQLALFDF